MKLKIALDFDGLIARTSIAKAKWINENVPNWGELLGKLQAKENLPEWHIASRKKVPLWLTDRINCIPLIGKENYEKMSLEIYGPITLQAPEIRGVKEGVTDMVKRGHELIILTSRRNEHLRFVIEWLKERKMDWLFSGIHSVREFGNKVPFCTARDIDVLIDDEIRFLRGKAPNLLKILVSTDIDYFKDSVTRVLENGKYKAMPIAGIIKAENIVYVPRFHPNVRDAIVTLKESEIMRPL